MDGSLDLTVGKVYETYLGIKDMVVVAENDEGVPMGYPKKYFVPEGARVPYITTGNIGKIKTPSIYEPGDVLDIRYMNDGLPNRMLISKKSNNGGEWFYDVRLESTGDIINIKESWLTPRVKTKEAPVYKIQSIKSRYQSGLRWMGNYTHNVANSKRQSIIESGLAKAFLREAYDRDGNIINGKSSVWIKYDDKNIINDDCTIGPKKMVNPVSKCYRNREECDLCICGPNGDKVVEYCVK
jgi:hypothetical protein